MSRRRQILVVLLIGPLLLSSVRSLPATVPDERGLYTVEELAAVYRHSPLGMPPPDPTNRVADNPDAARLGQALFNDVALSPGLVACSTCHQPARAFTDGLPVAHALGTGTRNTPTLLNEVFMPWLFWDGRSDSQWSQALQPFENPLEMGADRLGVLRGIQSDPKLGALYESVFGSLPPLGDAGRFPAHAAPGAEVAAAARAGWAGMTEADRALVNRAFSNVGKALAAYERLLVRGDSAFDRYVAALKSGDPAAGTLLSPGAKRGLKLFVGAGRCELCHSGPAFSDGQFHNLGLPVPAGAAADPGREAGVRQVRADPFNARGAFSDARGGVSQDRLVFLPVPESQAGAFRTPSLRNVTLTPPYMHDGRFGTLAQVLDFYAQGRAATHGRQIGVREGTVDLVPPLHEDQKRDLEAFLGTLTSAPLPAELSGPP